LRPGRPTRKTTVRRRKAVVISLSTWILVALSSAAAAPALLAFFVARSLGKIGREITELVQVEPDVCAMKSFQFLPAEAKPRRSN
jgi:hypothetical protein